MEPNNIELRSENVRKIIGQIPSRLVRHGILVIALVLALLLAAAALVPYPDTVACRVQAQDDGTRATALLPYRHIGTLRPGMEAVIEWEGYRAADYGYQSARVDSLLPDVVPTPEGNAFRLVLRLQPDSLPVRRGMTGQVSLVVRRGTLLQKVLGSTQAR